MNTYTITFRTSNGDVRFAWVKAHDVNEARSVFLAHYDGRIIAVELA